MATMKKFGEQVGVDGVTPSYRPIRRVRLFTFHVGNLPDPDNLTKLFLDGLKLAKYIVDDKQDWLEWSRPIVCRAQHAEPHTVVMIDDIDREPLPNYSDLFRTKTDAELFEMMERPRIPYRIQTIHPGLSCTCIPCRESYDDEGRKKSKPRVIFATARGVVKVKAPGEQQAATLAHLDDATILQGVQFRSRVHGGE